MTIRVEEGAGGDEVVGEVIIVAYIAGDGVGFEGKVKVAGARPEGGEGVTIGEGESEGR